MLKLKFRGGVDFFIKVKVGFFVNVLIVDKFNFMWFLFNFYSDRDIDVI